MSNEAGHPVLIVAPMGHDASAIAELLHGDQIVSRSCDSIAGCLTDIRSAHAAALLITEEALESQQMPVLLDALHAQPRWSELPLIVLTKGGESRLHTLLELTAAAPGSVIHLQRPLHGSTLLETIRFALRSRRRQYLVRDLLVEQQQNVLERQRRAEELEKALAARTRQVTVAQQSLALSQRMAAVGTLASGLAHDLGNVLMPLSARLESVLADSRLTGEHRTDLNVVVALLDHLRQMTKNLSLFSRDPEQEGIEGSTDLSQWIPRVHALIQSSLEARDGTPRIALHWNIPEDPPPVRIATHRLTQMILNLVHNARDAIRAKHQADPSSKASGLIRVEAQADVTASRVILRVIDNGIGMTDEVKRRCIELFYTTKDRPTMVGQEASISHGSGMGLALAQSIATKAGGELLVYSKFGEGTTIEVVLPIILAKPAAPEESRPARSQHRISTGQ